jgi:hypothetical protein
MRIRFLGLFLGFIIALFLSIQIVNSTSSESKGKSAESKFKFPFTSYLKAKFEFDFRDRCMSTYPSIIRQFTQRLENPGDRQLMFVFQEHGLHNGGLGDRLGGLVSAVTMAFRFNRTLIIRAYDGFDELFRPYHPTDIHASTNSPVSPSADSQDSHLAADANAKYLWSNFLDWSKYDATKANQDATEYDLYDCINNGGTKISHCSMDSGDADQPIILYRSNRAYLCHYESFPDRLAYKQMREVLNVPPNSDMFLLAGCMLRLVLWPRDKLWQLVDEAYSEYADSAAKTTGIDINKLYEKYIVQAIEPILAQRKDEEVSSFSIEDTKKHANKENSERSSKSRKLISTGSSSHFKRNLRVTDDVHLISNSSSHKSISMLSHNQRARSLQPDNKLGFPSFPEPLPVFYQVGYHYRCGDHSYIRGTSGGCFVTPENVNFTEFLTMGSPKDLGLCGKTVISNHTKELIEHHRPVVTFGEILSLTMTYIN